MKTTYDPRGIVINLSAEEIATAIEAYLISNNIRILGSRTIDPLEATEILVIGSVMDNGKAYSGIVT